MATVSLISGNCGRVKGEDNGLGLGFNSGVPNDFLASDAHIRLSRKFNGIWLKDLGGSRQGNAKKSRVISGVRKGKKHDYPWPDNIDPESKSPLTYLSHFKPLEEKPKPVTLAFEKPLIDLEQKIVEVIQATYFRISDCFIFFSFFEGLLNCSVFLVSLQVERMADDTGLDFTDQINALENKYQQVDYEI